MEKRKYKEGVTRNKPSTKSKCYSIRFDRDLEDLILKQPNRNKFINQLVRAYANGIVGLEEAKEAHRTTCLMVNCADCLFGVCRTDCDYQKEFERKLSSHERTEGGISSEIPEI